MSAPSDPVRPTPSLQGRGVHVEYLGFEDVPDSREYRFAVHQPEGTVVHRVRIANAAFGAGQARLQDGPEICYQWMTRAVVAGASEIAELVTIGDTELDNYREIHIRVPKPRSRAPAPPRAARPVTPMTRMPLRAPSPPPAPPPPPPRAPAFGAGQRVSHKTFGVGVVASSSRDHTIVCFDADGPKTFVTSMLELDVLSAPATWEIGARGKNRPRKTSLVTD
jgi:hypothetical protein